MHGYYIYDKDNIVSSGVKQKIQNQVDFFSNELGECQVKSLIKNQRIWAKIARRLPLFPDGANWNSILDEFDADYIYMRKVPTTISQLNFLRKVKLRYPKTIVIIEIPTYPYDKEMKMEEGLLFRPILFRDQIGRRFLHKYVDNVVVIGRIEKDLWKIPTIPLFNGIDMNKIKERVPDDHLGAVKLLCVANFARYHGIDCLLKGLDQYYRDGNTRDVEVHLVGEGDQYALLKKITDNSDFLKQKVFFYGQQDVEQINYLYNKCDIGVVSLGYSRIGLTYNTTIKSKEYMAAGLPFIGDTEIDILKGQSCRYFHQVRYGESLVDINEIISFYDEIFEDGTLESKKRIADEMRLLAEENVSQQVALKPICECIKSRTK